MGVLSAFLLTTAIGLLILTSNATNDWKLTSETSLEDTGHLQLSFEGVIWLTGTLSVTEQFLPCKSENAYNCKVLPNVAKVEIRQNSEFKSTDLSCLDIVFQSLDRNFVPEMCIDFGKSSWYGVAELFNQRWPLNDVSLPMQPFVTNDLVGLNSSYGNVIGRYWLNSDGVGVFVDEDTPLHASLNESGSEKICFRSDYKKPFYNIQNKKSKLSVTACKGRDIKSTHLIMSQKLATPPAGIPDSGMFKSPIWSTWARYKVDIDQTKVLEYADEILQNGFTNSQIEIDDMFSTFYGEFDFTSTKFKYPASMVKEMKRKGFRVTVWITPFANFAAPSFKEGAANSYWLEDERQEVPSLLKWWQGTGAILDVSNSNAVTWYLDRLQKMKDEYGVDSFKFDAGEVTYLPASYMPSDPWDNPCQFTKLYVEAVSEMGPLIEVRCGYNTQHAPVFVRMADKESRWGYNNGLKTMIPTALTLGILGYPYILPDMIGGNGYGAETDKNPFTEIVLPDRELYIRWLELTAYLPAMQFSFVPWQYDPEVVEIARKYVEIHEDIVTPILLTAAEEAQQTGAPIIRPLWWIAPTDEFALNSDSQFLVGDELMVAPVLEAGARHRDIYIPDGNWEDQLRNVGMKGPRWLKHYEVNLSEVATFRRK